MSFFPVLPDGAPHFGDDFNAVKVGALRSHHGIDIFANLGTGILAVDAGSVRFTDDPIGGHVFYLTATDGTTYYGAHLVAFEGASRTVAAGEIIGYVGDTGNAQGTSPHLHFEEHPPGGGVVDPFPELKALAPQFAKGGASNWSSRAANHLALPAKALLAAYMQKHGVPPPASIAYPMGQAIGEGSFGDGMRGSNNWGMMHATVAFQRAHASDVGYGLLAVMDRNAAGFYIARMAIFPSMALGAAAFLDQVENDVDLATVQSLSDYARALYIKGYFTMTHAPVTPLQSRAAAAASGLLTPADEANIADYTARVLSPPLSTAQAALAAAATATGDPTAVTVGPPFAPLEQRLTPLGSQAPHTLAHARQMLGELADHPPKGMVSVQDCIDAPNGPGVWLFAVPATTRTGVVTRALEDHPVATGAVAAGVVTFVVGALATLVGAHVLPIHEGHERRRRAA
jgi:hypothetical protein